jgi:hypothetical protein
MLHRPLRQWLLFFAWPALAASAAACSLQAGYLPPTNYELVRMAPAIVLAKAVASHSGNRTPQDPPMVSFEVQEVVKGRPPAQTFKLEGITDDYGGPSDEHSFAEVRPGAGRGACNAYDYRLGTSYLLFLGMGSSANDILGSPSYTRINEEAHRDSSWLMAVRHYARIAALNDPAAERRELSALLQQARTSPRDPRYPKPLRSDIEQHFATPSPYKTFLELLALHEGRGMDWETKADALWAMAAAPTPEAHDLFERRIRSGEWRADPHVASEFIVNTKDSQLASLLLAKLPGSRDENARSLILRAAITAAPASETPWMLRALSTATPDETRQLARWFARFPSAEATKLLKRRLKFDYGEDYSLAFIVAGFGDTDVLAWGARLIASRSKDAWMGTHVIAHSPLPLADVLARRTIRDGDEERVTMLVQGYKDSTNPNLWDRLADIAAMRPRPPNVDAWLKTVLKERSQEGDARAAELLRAVSAQGADARVQVTPGVATKP